MNFRIAGMAVTLFAAAALGGCTENPQLLEGQPMGTTVTRDTASWQGDPLTFQTDYQRGDQASWETKLAQRIQGQNEYIRIGGK